MKKILKQLIKIDSVSSNEEKLKEKIIDLLPKNCKIAEDNMGNLIVKKNSNKKNKKKIMITANLDETGLIATKIEKDGSVSFLQIGQVEINSLVGCYINYDNKLKGIIGSKPIHLQTEKEKKEKIKIENISIDFGFNSKEEAEKFLNIGDIFSFEADFSEILDEAYSGKALGDRFCCCMLIELLKNDIDLDITFVFIAKEKSVLNSAKTAAYLVEPDISIILKPYILKHNKIKQRKKSVILPVFDGKTRYDEELLDLTKKTAIKNNIPFENIVLEKPIITATNIASTKNGVKTIVFSLPCKQFSFLETVEKNDMQKFFKLTISFLEELVEKLKLN